MPSSKVKILKFVTHFGIGGTERQFVYITRGLDRSRFDVRVGCMARFGGFMKEVEALNVPIQEYKTKSLYSYQTLRGQLRLTQEIRREGIQIVHAYGWYPTVFTIPPAAVATNSVTIASVRDMGVFPDRPKMRTVTQTMACRMADCILANSHAVRGWLMKQGLGRFDIHVIPNGIVVPPERRPPDRFPVRNEFGIEPTAPLIGVISRLTRTKGIEVFIDAAAEIARQFPLVRFLIVGDSKAEPSYRTELEQRVASRNLKYRLIFAGQREDVPEILKEIDISVLPSLSESFSNSLLESMSYGLPVVASNVGGNPEIIDDGAHGILVPPENTAALARAITRLLESPQLCRQLGKAAHERALKDYSLDSVLSKTERLYMSLLERRNFAPYAIAAGKMSS